MRFSPTKIINLIIVIIVLFLNYSCSKDSDLLADYVVNENAGTPGNLIDLENGTIITSEDKMVAINILRNNQSSPKRKSAVVKKITQPKNGKTEIQKDTVVVYVPNEDFNGKDDFTYTVEETQEDNTTVEEEKTVSVDVSPVLDAVKDTVQTVSDKTVTVDVLKNDTFTNKDKVTITTTSSASKGTVVVNKDNTVTYTPNPDASGEDTFTYTAEVKNADNSISTDKGTVTVVIDDASPTPPANDFNYGKLKAFPTAYGAGRNSIGGRGGKVIHVSNLNDSGTGSFRAALLTPGPRTIVFDVSGNINLTSKLSVSGSSYDNITIAGQTAPQGGITITGDYNMSWYDVDNVIIRYIRFRMFPISALKDPDLEGGLDEIEHGGGSDIIYDHCSFSFGTDETISFVAQPSAAMKNVTLQRSIIGNSKTGSIMGTSKSDRLDKTGDFSWMLNLSTDTSHRFPNFGGNSRLDVLNNVVFNWLNRIVNVPAGSAHVNNVNNYAKEGTYIRTNPNYLDMYNKIQSPNNQKIYSEGNIRVANDGTIRSKSNTFYAFSSPGAEMSSTYMVSTPFPYIDGEYQILSANEAYNDVLSNVGDNRYINDSGEVQIYQDPYDTKKISNVLSGTPGVLYQINFSEWVVPSIPSNKRPDSYDSDKDGMSDTWEKSNGLNPNDANDANGDRNGDGYTNLEDFLNQVDFF